MLALKQNELARQEFRACHIHAGLLLAKDPNNESCRHTYARSLYGLGELELRCQEFETALELLLDALDRIQTVAESIGTPHVLADSIGTAQSDIGYIYENLDNRDEAQRFYLAASETLHNARQAYPNDASILADKFTFIVDWRSTIEPAMITKAKKKSTKRVLRFAKK